MNRTFFQKSVLLVGAGTWGKNLARNFHTLGALYAICDSREATLDIYTIQYPDVLLSTNYKSLLSDSQVTKVVIAAPAAQHYSLAKQALLAGKDVYVEKPLCLDIREGEELISLAEQKGLILMVGHLLQYHPCVRRLQEIVASGELGKLQYITSNRLNLGSIRVEENALWSFAPHDISVILSLCGHRLPTKLRCVGEAYLSQGVADTTMTTMRFEGDIRAHIYVNWLNPFKEQKLTVVGASGMAVFDDTQPWEEKLLLYRNHVKWMNGTVPQANKNQGERILVAPLEPLKTECEHFLTCCEKRLEPITNGKEGLRVLKVLQAAQASLNEDGEAKNPEKMHSSLSTSREFFSHPSAIIDPRAKIGPGTKIWHFSHIMHDAQMGSFCNIGQNVVISPEVILGKNVKIQNNVSVYSGVVCEDDVFLGPSAVFTNVLNPRSSVNRRGNYQKTIVRTGATIGANATIVCGIELGEYCFIGAGAVVTKSVKPFALMVGNPAKHIGWMSRHGEKLDLPLSISEDEELTALCPATGESYILKGSAVAFLKALPVEAASPT